MVRLWFFIAFFAVFLLSGCSDNETMAPVVNGWYQQNAASSYYVVRSGDTIYSIAFAFGLDYRALATANDMYPPYPLNVGQRLKMTHAPASIVSVVKPSKPSQPNPSIGSVKPAPFYPTQARARPVLTKNWLWPTSGRVIQVFSRNASGHPGISIAGKLGQPIRATASGRVVYSGDGVRGYGNLIIIKHNDQFLSAYAFNQQNLVQVGDPVFAGQVIARMGQNDAGRTLLYFEIRYDGAPVNPVPFLQGLK